MRLYQALVELLEARAEYIREDTATLQLGKFAEGYEAGREDIMETYGFEVAFIGDDEAEDD